MARAIGLEGVPRNARDDLRRKLDQAPDEHAEALLQVYELVQQLHDSGVLRLLRGVLHSGDLVVGTAVNAAKSDEAIRGLRNAIILARMLGAINPDLMQGWASAVSETLGCRTPVAEPPGLVRLLSEFRHPELRRSMALINKFLESLGNQLKTRGDCH